MKAHSKPVATTKPASKCNKFVVTAADQLKMQPHRKKDWLKVKK